MASRYVRSAGDFINAGRRLPMLLNATALFALWYGSETIFGASSEFVKGGFLGVIEDPFGGALCLFLYAIFFARRLYRENFLTLGDLFRDRYGKGVELLSAGIMMLSFIGWIAAQMVALGLLFQSIMGVTLATGTTIGAFIVGLYTLTGGMWAISVTDFLQSMVIIAGLIWIAVIMADLGGGVVNIVGNLPEEHFRLLPEARPLAILNYLAAWTVLGLGSLPSQDVFQRVNSARSERAAVWSTYLGASIYLLFAMLPLFIASAAKIIDPHIVAEDEQAIIPALVNQHAPLGAQVIFFGALISAILSTCSGAILAPASILSENVIRPLLGHRLSDRSMLRVLRLSVGLIAGAALAMSLSRKNIYELVAEASILLLVSLLVPMTAAVYRKRHSAAGAAFSMILGLLVWFTSEYIIETRVPSLIYGFCASLIAYWAGSRFDRESRSLSFLKIPWDLISIDKKTKKK